MKAPLTYGGIDPAFCRADESAIFLQSIIYDGSSTWGKGADLGFEAFMEASANMELYDIETRTEVYKKGIHTLETMDGFDSPEDMYKKVLHQARYLLEKNKFLTFLGGEHSISIGILQAYQEKYDDISILQLDAHADLRAEYLGSPYNHACALHQAATKGHVIQVGIRSMDRCELDYLDPSRCFFMQDIENDQDWMDKALALLKKKVYITLDLDVFDPAIMPATGTPEPGGMNWYPMLTFLKKVFSHREVMGFDIVELAPINGLHAPQFLVAKLYYKMLSYKYAYGK